jgi:hypothetical protein
LYSCILKFLIIFVGRKEAGLQAHGNWCCAKSALGTQKNDVQMHTHPGVVN